MISIDLTAKFHSLYVKESESEILERWESEILRSRSRSRKLWKGLSWIFYLWLRSPGAYVLHY